MQVTQIYELMTGLPPGVWVAISTEQEKVLSYGEDGDLVFEQALEMGEAHPLITRVPDPEGALFF